MSRSILIQAIYNNNKRNNRGLFDGKNCDMCISPFTSYDMRGIIDDTVDDIKRSKGVKGYNVYIRTSDSHGYGTIKTYTYNSIEDMRKDVSPWVTLLK